MKKILILFLTIVTFSVKSQTVEVNYSVEIDISGLQPKPFNHRYLLSYSNGKSLQKKFLMGAVSTHVINKNDESTRVIKIGNDTTYVYKDFSKNILYSEERIFTKVLSVADQLKYFFLENRRRYFDYS